MGWLGQVFCIYRSFSVICHQFHTNWEKCLLSGEYGVTIGRTIFEACCLRRPVEEGVTGVEESFGHAVSNDF